MKKAKKNKVDIHSGGENERSNDKHDFDHVLHKLLVIGLVISVILIITGLVLALVKHENVPTVVPTLGTVFSQLCAWHPSGFLALGILVVIATPIMRVVGSAIAFILEKDWRFAAITLVVLITVTVSIFTGNR